MEVLKGASNILKYFLVYVFFLLLVFLATLQVVSWYKNPQTYGVVIQKNGYNVFEDIFSDIDGLRETIKSLPNTSQNTETIKQINALEDKVTKISETVMNKPDQAITAKLLQNDQNAIKDRILKLEDDVKVLNSRIDTIYAIIVSLVIALGAFQGFVHIWPKKKTEVAK